MDWTDALERSVMRKKIRNLSLHRETLYHLSPHDLRVAGAYVPPFTRTQLPSFGCETYVDCTSGCPASVTCDSVIVC